MPAKPPKVILSRQIFETEPRRSKHKVDHLPNDVRDAVLAAMRIEVFYKNNPSNMIMPRDVAQILRQMQSQKVLICEIIKPSGAEIIASSILWDSELPIVTPDGRIDIAKFLETGTQLCVVNGYNFQWTLNAFTLLDTILKDPVGSYFAATYGDNHRSIANFLNNMKFQYWDNVPSTLHRLRMHHLEEEDEEHRGVCWFRPTLETVITAAERVVDLIDNPLKTVRSPRSGHVEVPQIEFECSKLLLDPIKEYSRNIVRARPKNLQELGRIIENASVSDSFLQPIIS